MNEAHFQITVDDLINTRRLHYRAYLKSKRSKRAFILGTLFMLAMGLITIWPFGLKNGLIITVLALAYWVVAYSLMLAIQYWRLPAQSRRHFEQHKALHAPHSITWSDSDIVFTSAGSTTRLAWTDFVDVLEDEQYIMLRQTEILFNPVPKRALTAEQITDLRDHANRPQREPL